MSTEDTSNYRPEPIDAGGREAPRTEPNRQERLKTLNAKWNQFADEFDSARERNDQEVMTNLRGLMLLIKREITRLGGEAPEFPYSREHHLADL